MGPAAAPLRSNLPLLVVGRLRELNGCTEETLPWDAEFPDCVAYQGCMPNYPLVWCETTGMGHSENVPISTEGFWKFWSALP